MALKVGQLVTYTPGYMRVLGRESYRTARGEYKSRRTKPIVARIIQLRGRIATLDINRKSAVFGIHTNPQIDSFWLQPIRHRKNR